MTKKKRTITKRQQSIASWATSIIALGIGLGNVAARGVESAGDWDTFVNFMIKDYGGWDTATKTFAIENAARGYIPIVAGVVFKKGTSELIKRCPVKSIMPSF